MSNTPQPKSTHSDGEGLSPSAAAPPLSTPAPAAPINPSDGYPADNGDTPVEVSHPVVTKVTHVPGSLPPKDDGTGIWLLGMAVGAIVALLVGALVFWQRRFKRVAIAELSAADQLAPASTDNDVLKTLHSRLGNLDERMSTLEKEQRRLAAAIINRDGNGQSRMRSSSSADEAIPKQQSSLRTAAPPTPIGARTFSAYREILLHPAIQDFTDWADLVGARGVRIAPTGLVQIEGDAGNALLVVVEEGGGAWLVPGGEIVAEFATRYQDPLMLRGHVEQAFELETDGGGTLKLVTPAVLDIAAGGWRIVEKGLLGGLRG